MKITEALFAEHQVFHNIFDHLERVAPRTKTLAEIKSLAALMECVMKAHSDAEDELFIRPLEHCFEQIGQRETFHQEHDEVERTLAHVRSARQPKKARQLLLQAVAACRKHVDKEERIVFPMAEQVLSAKTLTNLAAEWKQRRK
jgi:hemerythrin-like domain-containing protein